MNRREFLAASPAAAVAAAQPAVIAIDPKPLFDISPYLYMQFMEPLGITDSSVEASWDYDTGDWRKDLIETVKDLAPDVIRWGGLFSRYYKWREGVGPVASRPPMRNYVWGGLETNRVGTHEFVDLCRRTGAEPLYCVNFLGDGVHYGEGRSGDAEEAANWVSYANDPDNPERKRHGVSRPYGIKLWQLGNETSYGRRHFTLEETITHTIGFAKAMRARDRSIQLIGWGDRAGRGEPWAGELLKRAGEHLDYVAIHMMGMSPRRRDTVLRGLRYQKDPQAAWEELLELSAVIEKRVVELEQVLAAGRFGHGIAITEGHLSLQPHNANPILCEWLSAAYHARSLNIYQRHGAKVKIATAADFAGTRWTVNAVMMQTPRGVSYLLPVGSIMRLFKRHNGKQGIAVQAPPDLDVAASRTGDKIFLHVANLRYRGSVQAAFSVAGMRIISGRVFEIAPEDLRTAVSQDEPDVFAPRQRAMPNPQAAAWQFPAGSVSAVELQVAPS